MLGQHLEIQDLLAGAELIEKHVAGQICWHALQLSPHPFRLLLQGQHPRREPASQTQLASLLVSEPDLALARVSAQHVKERGLTAHLLRAEPLCAVLRGVSSAEPVAAARLTLPDCR